VHSLVGDNFRRQRFGRVGKAKLHPTLGSASGLLRVGWSANRKLAINGVVGSLPRSDILESWIIPSILAS